MVRKVMARKRANAAAGRAYTHTPMASVLIQSFNHRANIPGLVQSIRRTTADELIVCEDGSSDGSEHVWRRHLERPNDFLIVSNDLHELRAYSRAAALARGEFIVFLQDDDMPPANERWFSDALRLMRGHPKLAFLGCWNGCVLDLADIERSTPRGLNDWNLGAGWERREDPISSLDPESKIPFMFIDVVGIGPVFCRRKDFEALGGFDLTLSAPGEPGIWLDYEICLRAWVSGLQVGLYETDPFERNLGGQGTKLFGGDKRAENWRKNRTYVGARFGPQLDSLHRTIDELNRRLVPR
jgi:GT2 family glycosyltransferase